MAWAEPPAGDSAMPSRPDGAGSCLSRRVVESLKSFLQLSLNYPSLTPLKQPRQPKLVREGECAQPATCPLSRVQAGTVVCIKELCGTNAVTARLRELGLGEEQQVKLLSRNGSVICQVCNARLG